jgi:hypothetical protein
MNCKAIESILIDIIRGEVVDLSLKDNALAHVEVCSLCALQLKKQAHLSAGLVALKSSSIEEVPSHIESSLLNRFHENRSNVISFPQTNKKNWSYLYWLAAASVLLVVGFATIWGIRYQSKGSYTSLGVEKEEHNRSDQREAIASSKDVETASNSVKDSLIKDRPELSTFNRKVSYKKRSSKKQIYKEVSPTSNNETVEVTTGFMPIDPVGVQLPVESGEVVRVKLPRSTLANYGLPVNMDRINEPINADVLVGNDGMARAIRFVNYIER